MTANNVDPLENDGAQGDQRQNVTLYPQFLTKKNIIVKYLTFNAPNGSRTISDRNALVTYSDGWDVNLFTSIDKPKVSRTVHTSGVSGTYANLTFFGSKIYVIGFLPPGGNPLLVDYIIDGGEAQTRSIIASRANKTLGNQVLFESATLPRHNHTFSAFVKGAVDGRSYTLDYFQVVGSEVPSQQSSPHNLSLILGVAWGTSTLLILAMGAFTICWRRRRKSKENLSGHVGEHRSPSNASVYLEEDHRVSLDPYVYPGLYVPNLPSLTYAKVLGYKRHTFHTFFGAWRSIANPSESDLEVQRHDSLFTTSTSATLVPARPQVRPPSITHK